MTSEELANMYIETLRDTFGFKDIKWYDKDRHKVELDPLNCCTEVRTMDWQHTKNHDHHYWKVEYCVEHETANIYTKQGKFIEDLP